MMFERVSTLEKIMEKKNSEMMKMYHLINSRMSEYPTVNSSETPRPSLNNPMQVLLHMEISST